MENPPSRPTHRTIAREAGVSAVTVSLAFRNHPSIPEATRARIRFIAEAQGYHPDPVVSKLMHHLRMRHRKNISSNLVALGDRSEISSHYHSRVLTGALEQAEKIGYAMETIYLNDLPLSPARLGKILRTRGVEGLVLLPMGPVDLSRHVKWAEFSVVAASHSILKPRFHTVVPNQFLNMLRLCERLAAAGEKRIGIVMTKDQDLKVNHRFISAYLWHTMNQGGPLIPPLVLKSQGFRHGDLTRWMKAHDPKVVITFNQVMGLVGRMPEAIREKVKWVQTGTVTSAKGQSGIQENPEEVGRAAIDVLAGMIQRGERGIPEYPRCTEIEGVVTLGPTKEAL